MRSLYIKMILISLALGVGQASKAAEFADPAESYYEIPVYESEAPDILSLFGGGQTQPIYQEEMYELPVRQPRRHARRARQVVPPVKTLRASSRRSTAPAPRQSTRLAPRVRGGYCAAIRPQVTSIVGNANASCYLKLFHIESSCRFDLPQAAGNAGNPYAAYGLCSLERSPVIRRMQRRPSVCNDISTLGNQVRCCQAIMRKSPHYFGPVIHGKVPRCG